MEAVVVDVKQYITIRSGPTSKDTGLSRAYLGDHVTILSRTPYFDGDNTFVKVSYRGVTGYANLLYLKAVIYNGHPNFQTKVPANAPGYVAGSKYKCDAIMRGGPGTNYTNLGVLFYGEVATYTGESRYADNGRLWYHCYHLGQDCWISSKYTTVFPLNASVVE